MMDKIDEYNDLIHPSHYPSPNIPSNLHPSFIKETKKQSFNSTKLSHDSSVAKPHIQNLYQWTYIGTY